MNEAKLTAKACPQPDVEFKCRATAQVLRSSSAFLARDETLAFMASFIKRIASQHEIDVSSSGIDGTRNWLAGPDGFFE